MARRFLDIVERVQAIFGIVARCKPLESKFGHVKVFFDFHWLATSGETCNISLGPPQSPRMR